MCRSTKHINSLCQTPYFVQQKFKRLPFNIYKPIKPTLHNLFYVHNLYRVAYKLVTYIRKFDVLFYNRPIDIIDLSMVSPVIANRILTHARQITNVDESDKYYGEFEDVAIAYNRKIINAEWVTTNDQKFYLSYLLYVPDDVEDAIDLTVNQLIEYLVNVFLHNKQYTIYDLTFHRFNTVNDLERFIDTKFIKLSPKRRVIPRYKTY